MGMGLLRCWWYLFWFYPHTNSIQQLLLCDGTLIQTDDNNSIHKRVWLAKIMHMYWLWSCHVMLEMAKSKEKRKQMKMERKPGRLHTNFYDLYLPFFLWWYHKIESKSHLNQFSVLCVCLCVCVNVYSSYTFYVFHEMLIDLMYRRS